MLLSKYTKQVYPNSDFIRIILLLFTSSKEYFEWRSNEHTFCGLLLQEEEMEEQTKIKFAQKEKKKCRKAKNVAT